MVYLWKCSCFDGRLATWGKTYFTCSTSPWVMGWVWNRALALRSRVSPRVPSGCWVVLSVAWERRLKRAIFSVKLRVDRSGSSETGSWPSPSTLRTWAGFWVSLSWSWTTEPGWEEAWMLGSDRGMSMSEGCGLNIKAGIIITITASTRQKFEIWNMGFLHFNRGYTVKLNMGRAFHEDMEWPASGKEYPAGSSKSCKILALKALVHSNAIILSYHIPLYTMPLYIMPLYTDLIYCILTQSNISLHNWSMAKKNTKAFYDILKCKIPCEESFFSYDRRLLFWQHKKHNLNEDNSFNCSFIKPISICVAYMENTTLSVDLMLTARSCCHWFFRSSLSVRMSPVCAINTINSQCVLSSSILLIRLSLYSQPLSRPLCHHAHIDLKLRQMVVKCTQSEL